MSRVWHGAVAGRRWSLLGLAAIVALALAAAPAPADSLFPILEIGGDSHLLRTENDLTVDLYNLDAGGDTEGIALETPAGFGASIVHAVGTRIGDAEVGVVTGSGGKITDYQGSLLVLDPAAYAADANAQACDPGPHAATWSLSVSNVAHGLLTIPIAVDRAGGGYRLTMCLAAVHALSREVSEVYFETNGIFRNPGTPGSYLFDASVTPYGPGGTADTGAAYEVRGYELLPQLLSLVPVFHAPTKTLVATGKLVANGKPRVGINVHVYAARSADAVNWADLGVAVTGKDGSYTFSKKFGSFRYVYLYAHVNHYSWPTCGKGSGLPGGCASYSYDGRSSYVEKVVTSAEP